MRGFERRLKRLEAFGGCPNCEEARRAVRRAIAGDSEYEDAPHRCPSCGADARLTFAEIDRILAEVDDEGEGGLLE